MPTAAWKGFVHSWHTLGIVLKWMCITVVGIPVAIATCLLVAACALAFAALVLGAAAAVCAGVFYAGRWTLWFLLRVPYWISELRIHHAERRIFRLPTSEPRPAQMQLHPRHHIMLAQRRRLGEIVIQVPEQAHIAPSASMEPAAAAATELPRTIECQVCLEKKLTDEFPTRQPTITCDHPVLCCSQCLSYSITASFEGRIWDDIRCPICNIQLQHSDVAEFAPTDIFERYDKLSTRRALERQFPNFRWCVGPNCEYGEEHPEDPKQPMTTCTSCGFEACFYHNTAWHEGMTCDEYSTKAAAGALKAEKKTEKIIKKIAKRCPGCQRFINKHGGCSHMSCPCGKHFCWSCGHDYPGHTWMCKERL